MNDCGCGCGCCRRFSGGLGPFTGGRGLSSLPPFVGGRPPLLGGGGTFGFPLKTKEINKKKNSLPELPPFVPPLLSQLTSNTNSKHNKPKANERIIHLR
ncbi:hypothetical protein DERP_010050 [Dermatophagoides pteronyssinus]|uniref:Uncharacterized protein n=1 Tax=Dermatophagoides pteronyssinus TaxID=6956 RepID=A0ABQ8JFA6_DERPT|nr:hypothetical protein DERP_010050 [Dermatophagoides pteronyssinus]